MSTSPTDFEPLAFHETVETPEQVRLHFELAGLGTRSVAFLLDGLLRYGVLTGLLVAVVLVMDLVFHWDFGDLPNSLGKRILIVGAILLFFAVEWAYFAVFEWAWNGQTPGKRAMHLRVLKDGGGPTSFLDAALRNLLRPIDSSGPLSAVGILFIFFNRKHKRPGDLVAGTIVVREHPKTLADVLSQSVSTIPPTDSPFLVVFHHVSLAASEHEMINRFLQRRAQLDLPTRRRLAQQIAGVIYEKAKAQLTGAEAPVLPPEQCERFLEELMAYQQQQGEGGA